MGQILLTQEQLRIINDNHQEIVVPWHEIDSVSLYHLELPDSTAIYLTFDLESGEYVEVNSQDESWEELISKLPNYLNFDSALLQDALQNARPEDPPIAIYTKSGVTD